MKTAIQPWIKYTRIATIIHSLLIVVCSLYVYSDRSVSVRRLIETGEGGKEMIYDVIEDRRLIATLVSSQASIFCPLFLLFNLYESQPESASFPFELLLECVMPVGLAVSWFFCNTFNYHVSIALKTKDYWIESFLICSVMAVLMAETALNLIQLPTQIRLAYQGGRILLEDEECREKQKKEVESQ
ncbi:hypothetical protein BY458DRAFT_536964 [Sporodiniella umbellata]|nr:hypothetical protein BY458DRAFT_536964 [Sporodiniella umbellata]